MVPVREVSGEVEKRVLEFFCIVRRVWTKPGEAISYYVFCPHEMFDVEERVRVVKVKEEYKQFN